jgi:hypothetical protein
LLLKKQAPAFTFDVPIIQVQSRFHTTAYFSKAFFY